MTSVALTVTLMPIIIIISTLILMTTLSTQNNDVWQSKQRNDGPTKKSCATKNFYANWRITWTKTRLWSRSDSANENCSSKQRKTFNLSVF